MDTIELFIEDFDQDGIKAISFVNDPAIEENWVALNKQEVAFKSVDEDKRIVIGIALKPDLLIPRVKGDYQFNVIFSKETVKEASHLYLKQLNNNEATLEHEEKAEGLSVVESWLVEDPKNDKSNIYGLEASEGDWVVMMSVDNEDVWAKVKDGTFLGYSIEGSFADRVIEASKPKEMTEERAAELLLVEPENLTDKEAQEIVDLLKSQLI
jgi:hypothetical protein